MVACDRCGVWQHTKCLGLPHEQDQMDKWKGYKCEQCQPNYHKELLTKLEAGEKPWKGTGWWREDCQEYAPLNKRNKKDRKSLPTKQSTPAKQQTPAKEKTSVKEEKPSASSSAKASAREKPETPTPAPPSVALGAQEKNKRKPSLDSDVLDQVSHSRPPFQLHSANLIHLARQAPQAISTRQSQRRDTLFDTKVVRCSSSKESRETRITRERRCRQYSRPEASAA